MKHNRFKTSRICSSDNYERSSKAHLSELRRAHEKFVEVVEREQPLVLLMPYITVFGNKKRISEAEAKTLPRDLVKWERL